MSHDNVEKLLPKLKDGKKVEKKQNNSKQVKENQLKKDQIKKSKKQSIIALIFIITGYIISVLSIIASQCIDSLIGWLSYFIFSPYTVVLGLLLLFIGFIINAFAIANDKDNKIAGFNFILLTVPFICIFIYLIK